MTIYDMKMKILPLIYIKVEMNKIILFFSIHNILTYEYFYLNYYFSTVSKIFLQVLISVINRKTLLDVVKRIIKLKKLNLTQCLSSIHFGKVWIKF